MKKKLIMRKKIILRLVEIHRPRKKATKSKVDTHGRAPGTLPFGLFVKEEYQKLIDTGAIEIDVTLPRKKLIDFFKENLNRTDIC